MQIKDELHLDAEVRNNHPDDAALFVLTPGELHARLAKATEAWRAEDAKATGMRSRLEAALQVRVPKKSRRLASRLDRLYQRIIFVITLSF